MFGFLVAALATADRYPVGTVVCVRDPEMKQAWCRRPPPLRRRPRIWLAITAVGGASDCSLRDTKDLRFGMGMGSVHVSTPERRDRLWLINGLAVVLLTLLGAASEAVGYDRILKTNTSKRREHSLFRQGCMVYDLIPTMPERWLQPLMVAFTRLLEQQPFFSPPLGAGVVALCIYEGNDEAQAFSSRFRSLRNCQSTVFVICCGVDLIIPVSCIRNA